MYACPKSLWQFWLFVQYIFTTRFVLKIWLLLTLNCPNHLLNPNRIVDSKQKLVVCAGKNSKAPCKRTQHVGATSPNIVGIVLADVGFRVFKRSQDVGQCCFYGNTEGSLGLIFIKKSLRNCKVVTFVRHYGADVGKRENASLMLLFSAILKILPVT